MNLDFLVAQRLEEGYSRFGSSGRRSCRALDHGLVQLRLAAQELTDGNTDPVGQRSLDLALVRVALARHVHLQVWVVGNQTLE